VTFYFVGADGSGASAVLGSRALVDDPAAEPLTVQTLWEMTEGSTPLVLDPAGCSFRRASLPPAFSSDMHRTDTIDFGVVSRGSVRLDTEDGGGAGLVEGDLYLIAGVPHRWVAGADGAVLSVSHVGLAPAAEGRVRGLGESVP
jgi:quercetin dioxygenase-like cupin family protein